MAIYNVHAGHCPQGMGASGACGYLIESDEAREVKDHLINILKNQGHTVYDCTCDRNTTQIGCLRDIVSKCNSHDVDLDISIHLNAGGGSGVEVWNFDGRTEDVSDRICERVSKTLSIPDRGTKYGKGLYVLNSTNALAILVECCFVDNIYDYDQWDSLACARAIAEGVLNANVNVDQPHEQTKPTTDNPASTGDVVYQVYAEGRGWLANVVNSGEGDNGYAGLIGKPILALRANSKGDETEVGYLIYRAHILGGDWYDWQKDRIKDGNGENFAGDRKNRIDGIQMTTAESSLNVRYRVHTLGGEWLDWVDNYGEGDDGYAGLWGHPIDGVQIMLY